MGIGANLELPLLEELAPGQPWAPGPRGVISEFMSAATPEVAIAVGRRAIQTPPRAFTMENHGPQWGEPATAGCGQSSGGDQCVKVLTNGITNEIYEAASE